MLPEAKTKADEIRHTMPKGRNAGPRRTFSDLFRPIQCQRGILLLPPPLPPPPLTNI